MIPIMTVTQKNGRRLLIVLSKEQIRNLESGLRKEKKNDSGGIYLDCAGQWLVDFCGNSVPPQYASSAWRHYRTVLPYV